MHVPGGARSQTIRRKSGGTVAGEVEGDVKAERLTTVIRLINEEYFIAVTLQPSGNLGKARFLLRTRGQALTQELTY